VFWTNSPRAIAPADAKAIIAALPPTVTPVGVFVDESPETLREVLSVTGVTAVQLHGDEKLADFAFIECAVLKSATLDHLTETARAWSAETMLLLDAADRMKRGGTGVVVDWNKAAAAARNHKIVLAGGLTPLNVEEAIRSVRPVGVDVASGVEASPGIKDFAKVSAFLTNARRAFGAL